MIKAKFLFPNFGGKAHELQVAGTSTVAKVKTDVIQKIMQDNNYNKQDHDAKIRLFSLGSELQDNKTLKEYHKAEDADTEMVVNVFISFQKSKKSSSVSNKKEGRGDSICNCALF